jgi:hypothetical protein
MFAIHGQVFSFNLPALYGGASAGELFSGLF